MTGNSLIASLRLRLNDQGDDTQLASGTANKQYFWSSYDAGNPTVAEKNELLFYLNMACRDLFRESVDLDRKNELKNLIATTSASDLSAVTGYYHAFSAFIDGRLAVLIDDPMDLSHARQTQQLAVTIVGYKVIRNMGAAHTIYYYKHPSAIAADDAAMTEMTDRFYTAVIDLAEYYAVHKDLARERITLRREFGKQNIEMDGVIDFLQNSQ